MKQILYTAPFTPKYRDYLKIVLASKRITIKLAEGVFGSKKKNENEEDRPGDRAMRNKMNEDLVDEEEKDK